MHTIIINQVTTCIYFIDVLRNYVADHLSKTSKGHHVNRERCLFGPRKYTASLLLEHSKERRL